MSILQPARAAIWLALATASAHAIDLTTRKVIFEAGGRRHIFVDDWLIESISGADPPLPQPLSFLLARVRPQPRHATEMGDSKMARSRIS